MYLLHTKEDQAKADSSHRLEYWGVGWKHFIWNGWILQSGAGRDDSRLPLSPLHFQVGLLKFYWEAGKGGKGGFGTWTLDPVSACGWYRLCEEGG